MTADRPPASPFAAFLEGLRLSRELEASQRADLAARWPAAGRPRSPLYGRRRTPRPAPADPLEAGRSSSSVRFTEDTRP